MKYLLIALLFISCSPEETKQIEDAINDSYPEEEVTEDEVVEVVDVVTSNYDVTELPTGNFFAECVEVTNTFSYQERVQVSYTSDVLTVRIFRDNFESDCQHTYAENYINGEVTIVKDYVHFYNAGESLRLFDVDYDK
tara:strand:- start:8221 stop:8634 length:414 start_codon:yes stop_codon:yes gene_type:complete